MTIRPLQPPDPDPYRPLDQRRPAQLPLQEHCPLEDLSKLLSQGRIRPKSIKNSTDLRAKGQANVRSKSHPARAKK